MRKIKTKTRIERLKLLLDNIVQYEYLSCGSIDDEDLTCQKCINAYGEKIQPNFESVYGYKCPFIASGIDEDIDKMIEILTNKILDLEMELNLEIVLSDNK